MKQNSFDYEPHEHARREGRETSAAAAESMVPSAKFLMGKILAALKERGPMTRSEVAKAVNLTDYQVSKRLSDLNIMRHIEDTGTTRPGPTGRQQTVWRACA